MTYSELCEAKLVLRKIHPRFMNKDACHRNISLFRKMNSLLLKNELWLSRGIHPFFKHISNIVTLLEKLCEPLFIFIIGKLSLDILELIIPEVTELILAASFDETTGSMLYLHNIRDGIEEYVKGKRLQSENTAIEWNFNEKSSFD